MTHPHEQQPGPQTGSGDHNRTITTGDITGNTGPIAIGWNIVQKILHVEIPIDDKSRQSLIAQVREFWVEGVLDKSLYRESWSALGLYADPKAITYAGQLASVKGEREPQPLPADVSIDRVFDDAHQRLLILGAPGGGKTTLLLELAQVLLHRAAQDKEQAIPVVFNLSSWAQQRQPLDKWLVQELRANYGVGKNLAQQWVRKNAILPLLDGLDEVAETHRAACVTAINAYCAEHGPEGIVVCSRIADYRAIGAKLELNEAVVVQPLTDTQIANYLDQAGEPLEGVRTVLAQDAELQKLVRVPLMLNIVSLAYQGERPEELRGVQPAEQRRRLFDHYVQRMLERPRKPEQLDADTLTYPHDKTKHWLRWLAGRLHENNLTVFEMERMQPWWLSNWWQRGLYVLLSSVGAGIAGATLNSLLVLLMGLLIIAPIVGIDVGLGFAQNTVTNSALYSGLIIGFVAGLLVSLYQRMLYHHWLPWLVGVMSGSFVVFLWFILEFARGRLDNLFISSFLASFAGISVGLLCVLMVKSNGIRPTETLRWSWVTVQRRWWIGLVFGFIGMCWGLGLSLGLGHGLTIAPVTMPIFGLTLGLFFGLISGVTQTLQQSKSRTNEGIWRSMQQSIDSFVVLGLGFGLTFVLIIWLIFGLGRELSPGLGDLLLLSLAFGSILSQSLSLPVGFYFGGLAFLQHWVLRLLCTLSGYAPWCYARFLDYATERILLRRVGGSYIFVHRMLLEYFANLEQKKIQT
jgi:energy-coupling factor transporter ATP-binding protein EcfA2